MLREAVPSGPGKYNFAGRRLDCPGSLRYLQHAFLGIRTQIQNKRFEHLYSDSLQGGRHPELPGMHSLPLFPAMRPSRRGRLPTLHVTVAGRHLTAAVWMCSEPLLQ